MSIRLPNETHRTIVLGRTGSGKSVGAIWLLAQQNFHKQPWIVIDYKGEDLFTNIVEQNNLEYMDVEDPIPKDPGIYVVRPSVIQDDDAVNAMLYKIYNQGEVGIFIDEGYALPRKSPLMDMIFTQGRSKHIPVIALYQRPVWMSRFAVAQADFFMAFTQNDQRDIKVLRQFIPPATVKGEEIHVDSPHLPQYYCLYSDVQRAKTCVLKAAPVDMILPTFKKRLQKEEDTTEPHNRQEVTFV
jgi:hypothetical protein